MRTGDLTSAAAKMTLATKTLRTQWEQTRSQWNDGTSDAFEKNHVQQFEPQVAATLAAASRVAEMLERARQECSEERM
jgi:hypothetical protein